jgi:hypothetical protein
MKRMTKLSAVSSALAMAGALAFSGQVFADTVTAEYTGVSPGQVVTINYNNTSLSGYAGSYDFTGANGPINMYDPGKFASLCVDLVDDIYTGNTVTWDVISLADTPNPPGDSMGATKADALARLLGGVLGTDLNNVRDTSTYQNQIVGGISSDQLAAALQIATWEIVWEDTTNYDYALNDGDFKFTSSGKVLNQANSWLEKVTDKEYNTAMQGLVGLTNPTTPADGPPRQDFIAQVPIPAAAWLFGSALVGAVGLGRRKPKVEV